MKKILLSAVALMSMMAANAQDAKVPYVLSAVGDNTYAVTMTQEEMAANYDAAWIADAWGGAGVSLPKGTVMIEDDNLVIKAGVESCYVLTTYGKLSDIQKTYPNYTGYVNLGSSLATNNWAEDVMIQDIEDQKAGSQAIPVVVPKANGKLSFGVYAGNNSREIGIYKLATEAEKENDDFGKMIAMNNFRNEDQAPAYVEADVEAGREYALLGGGNKNLCMHEVKFVPTGGPVDGISTVNAKAENNIEAIYTLSGAQVNSLQNGVNIVKLSNGKSVKVIK